VHKLASRKTGAVRVVAPSRGHLSATHLTRAAVIADCTDIHELLAPYAERGLVLPRTLEDIERAIADYVVVVDPHDRLAACAALVEYSPSLAEVASVAVTPAAQGTGLGTLAVRGVEAMARRRGVQSLFALSLAERFFESLDYERAPVSDFPEKLARYEALQSSGIPVIPKACFQKQLT
jgi:N-acetylglutamate synthase-like GNAT family acetyltransferase